MDECTKRMNQMNLGTLISMNEKGYVLDINDGKIANIRKEKE